MDETRELADKAKDKRSLIGTDVELKRFNATDPNPEASYGLEELAGDEKNLIAEIGIKDKDRESSGTYIQVNKNKVIYTPTSKKIELLPIKEAIKRYNWIKNYYWRAVSVDTDKYTSNVELDLHNGYFIRAHRSQKAQEPVQACLLLKSANLKQNIHNLIIAEEDSELHVITGCVSPSTLEPALHLGITEFYVKKNAKLTFTMIHRWGKNSYVRPRSAAIIEEGGVFINNYIILGAVGDIQTYPTVYLRGRKAKAELYSVIYGTGKSLYDVGGRVVLESEETSGKVISRSIANDESTIYARGQLLGKSPNSRAHLECNGLLLSEKARLIAVPELEAQVTGVELSHEASVGKIQQEQLIYLMSRGLTEDEANSLIVRGFMSINVPDMPSKLKKTIDDAIQLTKLKGF